MGVRLPPTMKIGPRREQFLAAGISRNGNAVTVRCACLRRRYDHRRSEAVEADESRSCTSGDGPEVLRGDIAGFPCRFEE